MVQATNFRNLHDLPDLGPLDWPPTRRIFPEGKVSSCAVIVREVGSQQAAQVAFAQDENVIETLAPDRADEPFCEGVLPRTVGRGQHFTDAQALHALPKSETVDAIAIAEEIGRRGVVREGVDELLGGPGGGGMLGDVEVDDAPVVVGEHDHTQSFTSVLRPGTWAICAALARIQANASSKT